MAKKKPAKRKSLEQAVEELLPAGTVFPPIQFGGPVPDMVLLEHTLAGKPLHVTNKQIAEDVASRLPYGNFETMPITASAATLFVHIKAYLGILEARFQEKEQELQQLRMKLGQVTANNEAKLAKPEERQGCHNNDWLASVREKVGARTYQRIEEIYNSNGATAAHDFAKNLYGIQE